LPEIRGTISALPGKTQIKIRMMPHIFALTFLFVLLLGIVSFCIGILYGSLTHQRKIPAQDSSSPMPNFFYMAIGLYVIFTIGYRVEAQKSKAFLRELLHANEVN
jgi:hypothetical protein